MKGKWSAGFLQQTIRRHVFKGDETEKYAKNRLVPHDSQHLHLLLYQIFTRISTLITPQAMIDHCVELSEQYHVTLKLLLD